MLNDHNVTSMIIHVWLIQTELFVFVLECVLTYSKN